MQRIELGEGLRIAVLRLLNGLGFAGDGRVPLEEAGVGFRLHAWGALEFHGIHIQSFTCGVLEVRSSLIEKAKGTV